MHRRRVSVWHEAGSTAGFAHAGAANGYGIFRLPGSLWQFEGAALLRPRGSKKYATRSVASLSSCLAAMFRTMKCFGVDTHLLQMRDAADAMTNDFGRGSDDDGRARPRCKSADYVAGTVRLHLSPVNLTIRSLSLFPCGLA
jgi:hypothetical protein